MKRHTPGPWMYVNGQIIYDADYGGPFRSICQMNGNNDDANAHLIAAGPELYAAVKALEHAIGMGVDADPEIYRNAHKLAASAIAKAEGRGES